MSIIDKIRDFLKGPTMAKTPKDKAPKSATGKPKTKDDENKEQEAAEQGDSYIASPEQVGNPRPTNPPESPS